MKTVMHGLREVVDEVVVDVCGNNARLKDQFRSMGLLHLTGSTKERRRATVTGENGSTSFSMIRLWGKLGKINRSVGGHGGHDGHRCRGWGGLTSS